MADDDDKPKKYTLESLFRLYSNVVVIPLDLDNINYDCILLSQIDYWLDQAQLLRSVFSLTDTGLAYMKFCKWRLDYEDFEEFLEIICTNKTKITVDAVKASLLEAGVPNAGADIVVVK